MKSQMKSQICSDFDLNRHFKFSEILGLRGNSVTMIDLASSRPKAEQPEEEQSPIELVLQFVLIPYNRGNYPFRTIKTQGYALLT
jgi:hypothetical protein